MLFLRADTQWIYSGLGQRIGLNYLGVESIARILNIELTEDLFGRLQIAERARLREESKHGGRAE